MTPGQDGSGGRTGDATVAREAKLFKDHLVAVQLQGGQGVGLLGEDKAGLGGVASLGRLVVKELAVPDLFLCFPVDDEALFDRAAEGHLAKVLALVQLGADIDLAVAVARQAVWDYPGLVRVVARHEPGLDGVGAIVEDECSRGGRWSGGPRLFAACHVESSFEDAMLGEVGKRCRPDGRRLELLPDRSGPMLGISSLAHQLYKIQI